MPNHVLSALFGVSSTMAEFQEKVFDGQFTSTRSEAGVQVGSSLR
jgi:hypothetical protein